MAEPSACTQDGEASDPVFGLRSAEQAARLIWPDTEFKVEVLSGGLTNANYKVSVGGDAFALRIQAPNTAVLSINREAELVASRLAAAAGVAPEVILSLEKRNVLVTRFIAGNTPDRSSMRAPEMIDRVGQCFRALHQRPEVIPADFNPFSACRQYGAVSRTAGVDGGPPHAEADRLAARIERVVDFRCTVPSHCDAAWLNFLQEPDGRLWLIDWEYAGMSDWRQDLSDVSGYHDFGVDDDYRLIEAYRGSVTEADVASLRVLRFMIMFRSALWGLVQQAYSELDEDYRSWTEEWLARTADYGNSREFTEHLAALEAGARRR